MRDLRFRLCFKCHKNLGMVSEPVVSANGQPLDIKGKCELEIFLGGVSVVHPVLVTADVTQDCLLGIDFLGKHNCTTDLNDRSIKIGREVVSLKGKNESPKVFQISLVETVVVPGCHEMILGGLSTRVFQTRTQPEVSYFHF